MMNEKRFRLIKIDDYVFQIHDIDNDLYLVAEQICNLLNEQQDTLDKQELRLQHLEELLELSENLNKSYREKLIDMNLKMVIDDE